MQTKYNSIKKKDVKPVCSCIYPALKLHKVVLKQIKHFEKLGVPKQWNNFKWGLPYFMEPKPKIGRVHCFCNLKNVNMKLKHNPHPMVKIQDINFK